MIRADRLIHDKLDTVRLAVVVAQIDPDGDGDPLLTKTSDSMLRLHLE